ncbi:MAG: hypothetical protein L3J91_03605, partial [Thermoplasmata archaeon]|nr:hypothetical protein [Thermoplasmata archaeon]
FVTRAISHYHMATMLGLIFWVPAPWWQRGALGGLAATAVVGPLWLIDPVAAAGWMAAAMTLTILIVAFGTLAAGPEPALPRRFLYSVGGALAAMTAAGVASVAVPGWGGDGVAFAVVGLVVMLAEASYLLHEGLLTVTDPTPPFTWSAELLAPV